MPEPETVFRLETNDGTVKTVIDIITLTISVVGSYYCLDPDGFKRNCDKVVAAWKRIKFKVSVWQTAEAINSLPVTDITDITDHNE